VLNEKFTFARWSRKALNSRNAKTAQQTDRLQPREEWASPLGVKTPTM